MAGGTTLRTVGFEACSAEARGGELVISFLDRYSNILVLIDKRKDKSSTDLSTDSLIETG
jgi:hypothetical protein